MSNFTTNDKTSNPISNLKNIVKNKTDKQLEKIPGYKKIKKSIPKGLSVDIGKDKVTIGYSKKF